MSYKFNYHQMQELQKHIFSGCLCMHLVKKWDYQSLHYVFKIYILCTWLRLNMNLHDWPNWCIWRSEALELVKVMSSLCRKSFVGLPSALPNKPLNLPSNEDGDWIVNVKRPKFCVTLMPNPLAKLTPARFRSKRVTCPVKFLKSTVSFTASRVTLPSIRTVTASSLPILTWWKRNSDHPRNGLHRSLCNRYTCAFAQMNGTLIIQHIPKYDQIYMTHCSVNEALNMWQGSWPVLHMDKVIQAAVVVVQWLAFLYITYETHQNEGETRGILTSTTSVPGVPLIANTEKMVAVVLGVAKAVRAWISISSSTLPSTYSPSPLKVYSLPSMVVTWGSPKPQAKKEKGVH